jgi:ubiquinone/menaquinone biosynthesis C-methylase UbiE
MRRPAFIARQSGNPTGLVGRVIAAIMERETVRENEAAIELLEPEPADRVLDLGCGHGRTLPALADRVPHGLVTGVDHSALMLERARRRCERPIRAGRVVLRRCDAARLPFDDGAFDAVLSVHTIYFWPDPPSQLREVRRVLNAGGRLVLGMNFASTAAARSFPASVYRFYSEEQVRALLAQAGFVDVRRSTPDGLRDGVALLRAARAV